ncbi:hypothetical protein [Noviherbaspirillum autotrophicum]|nr:hypothetical protein [Noviherbaspirillum autotrophicum]
MLADQRTGLQGQAKPVPLRKSGITMLRCTPNHAFPGHAPGNASGFRAFLHCWRISSPPPYKPLRFMLNHCSDTSGKLTDEIQLVNHPSFDLSFVEHGNYVRIQWKGRQTLSTIQEGCKHLHKLLLEYEADKVLNDGRYVVGSWATSVPWIVYRFLPLARRAGMRMAAHVLAHERHSKLSAHAVRLVTDFCEWNIELFQTIDTAEAWLTRQSCGKSS